MRCLLSRQTAGHVSVPRVRGTRVRAGSTLPELRGAMAAEVLAEELRNTGIEWEDAGQTEAAGTPGTHGVSLGSVAVPDDEGVSLLRDRPARERDDGTRNRVVGRAPELEPVPID